MKRKDTQFLHSILGNGKLIEVEFEQYKEHLNINVLTKPEYDSLYLIPYEKVVEYSEESKAMRYLKQIYPDFQKCYAYIYDIVGPKDREKYGWNVIKESEYYNICENDCKFIIAIPNIKKLNLSTEEKNVNINVF